MQVLRVRLSFTQEVEGLLDSAERGEHRTQVQPEVDGLCQRGAIVREMAQRGQGLLQIGHGLLVCRALGGLDTRLTAVGHRLVPDLTPERVMGQPFHVVGHTVLIEPFDSGDDVAVERALPLLEQAPVGHLVRQGVHEGVRLFGKELRLIQELGRLEVWQDRAAAPLRAARQWPATGARGPPCQ